MGFKNKRVAYLMIFMVLLAFLVACYVGARRYVFEQQNMTIDLVMPLHDIKRLATLDSRSLKSLLVKFRKESTLSTIVVDEETLADFEDQGKVTIFKGSEIINLHRVGHINRFVLTHLYSGKRKPKADHHYVIVEKNEDFERLKTFFRLEFGSDKVKEIGRWNILEVIDEEEDLMGIGLGVTKSTITNLQEMGYSVLIRLKNSNRLNAQLVKEKFKTVKELTGINTIMFDSDRVLGFPSQLDLVHYYFKELSLNLGVIEFTKQKGIKSLAKRMPGSVIRVHSIPVSKMNVMAFKDAQQRYIRAAKERSVKILFLHPFFDIQKESNIIDYNLNFINGITDKLKHYNFSVAPLEKTQGLNFYQSAQEWELLLLTMGVFALIIILLNYYVPMSFFNVMVFYLFLGIIFYVVMIFEWLPIWNRTMALIIACVFPPLALISQFPKHEEFKGKSLLNPVLFMLKVVGITLIGSVLIVGFLSDIRYLFGIFQFYGVKISLIVPLILIGLYFYLRPQRINSIYYVFKRLFYAPIRTSYLLSVLLCLFFIMIYIVRSGNYFNFYIPFVEEKIRAFGEEVLFVRPRTKEFLIGYPVLLFSYYFVDRDISRNWLWFYMILGSVGLISLINSFCHLHTPVLVSFYRTFLGLGLGIGMGVVYIVLYQLGKMFLRKSFVK